jgi:Flp pilus assembly protein TadB
MKQNTLKETYLDHFRNLERYLTLAGIKKEPRFIFTALFIAAAAIDLALLIYFIIQIIAFEAVISFILIITLIMLTLGYAFIFLILWLLFLAYIDYLKFKRKQAVEDILPEFLRLVANNHRAGLPLEMSFWKANKPRFGVFAEEINDLARKTYATGDIIEPLRQLGQKYDSSLLRRVITNIIEGMKTGSDIAKLFDEVATNIMTIKNTRKELASEVENYMIFITITVVVISPLMFALTHNLSSLIENVKNTLSDSTQSEEYSKNPIQLNFAQGSFSEFFDIFVYLMIGTNCIVSVLLISTVKYGNVKQDLKRIPVFYIICVVVYLVCKKMFGAFFVI